MADLYTTLEEIKLARADRDGQSPPNTAACDEAQELFNPEYTLRTRDGRVGAGGLQQDPEKGVRCPICGVYKHNLGTHLQRVHVDLGGKAIVYELLDIHESVALASRKFRQKRTEDNKRRWQSGMYSGLLDRINARPRERGGEHGKKISRTRRAVSRSMSHRNMRHRCPAQMTVDLQLCYDKIGRLPSKREVKALAVDGFRPAQGLVTFAELAFGTWNNFVAQCGYRPRKAGHQEPDLDMVLAALKAWHEVHGDLPLQKQIKYQNQTPVMPSDRTILRALDTLSWPKAMQLAATQLGIYGGRYGLPAHMRPKVVESEAA